MNRVSGMEVEGASVNDQPGRRHAACDAELGRRVLADREGTEDQAARGHVVKRATARAAGAGRPSTRGGRRNGMADALG